MRELLHTFRSDDDLRGCIRKDSYINSDQMMISSSNS